MPRDAGAGEEGVPATTWSVEYGKSVDDRSVCQAGEGPSSDGEAGVHAGIEHVRRAGRRRFGPQTRTLPWVSREPDEAAVVVMSRPSVSERLPRTSRQASSNLENSGSPRTIEAPAQTSDLPAAAAQLLTAALIGRGGDRHRERVEAVAQCRRDGRLEVAGRVRSPTSSPRPPAGPATVAASGGVKRDARGASRERVRTLDGPPVEGIDLGMVVGDIHVQAAVEHPVAASSAARRSRLDRAGDDDGIRRKKDRDGQSPSPRPASSVSAAADP